MRYSYIRNKKDISKGQQVITIASEFNKELRQIKKCVFN